MRGWRDRRRAGSRQGVKTTLGLNINQARSSQCILQSGRRLFASVFGSCCCHSVLAGATRSDSCILTLMFARTVYIHQVHVFARCQMLHLIIFAENRMGCTACIVLLQSLSLRKGAFNDQDKNTMTVHRELRAFFLNVWEASSGGCWWALNNICVYCAAAAAAAVGDSVLSPWLC